MAKLRVDKIASVGVSTETTGSVFFDGTGDYLQISDSTDFTMGSGDYTIEGWFYLEDVSSRRFYGQRASDASQLQFLLETNSSSVLVYYFSIGDTNYSVTGNALAANRWYHIAVTRSGNVHTLYVDGTSVATRTQSGSLDDRAQPFSIGRQGNYTAETFSGYISNFRICKGHAVYKSNFAVPTRELDVHPGPDDDRTVLLACYDGENIFAEKTGRHIIAAYGDRSSTPTPASTDSPIGITTLSPGLDRDVDNTFGPSFQGGAGYNSQNWLTLPKGTTTDRNRTGGRGIFAGGGSTPYTNAIEFITISSSGNSLDFGDLTQAKQSLGGTANSTRGIFASGYIAPANTRRIEYISIASQGNAVNFEDITTAIRYASCAANSTRALIAGGFTPSYMDRIEYITIATLGDAKDFGDLTANGTATDKAGLSSPTRALFAGGEGPSMVSQIDYVTIATLGDAADFGDLTAARRRASSASSGTRGLVAAGYNGSSYVDTIDYVTIASLGNAQDFGNVTQSRSSSKGQTCSTIRGVFGSGKTPSLTNTIDYVTIASTGNANDFGDTIGADFEQAGCSDSHGGIS